MNCSLASADPVPLRGSCHDASSSVIAISALLPSAVIARSRRRRSNLCHLTRLACLVPRRDTHLSDNQMPCSGTIQAIRLRTKKIPSYLTLGFIEIRTAFFIILFFFLSTFHVFNHTVNNIDADRKKILSLIHIISSLRMLSGIPKIISYVIKVI